MEKDTTATDKVSYRVRDKPCGIRSNFRSSLNMLDSASPLSPLHSFLTEGGDDMLHKVLQFLYSSKMSSERPQLVASLRNH